MKKALKWLDELAETEHPNPWALWLRRASFVFLLIMAVSMPHSIAATQTAWITGMFLWLVSLVFKPQPTLRPGKLEFALWAFFIWSAITSFTSYAPDISIDKLRGVAVFLIFVFVIRNVRNRRSVYVIAFALIASCMVNVVWMPIERLIGRGVEIHGLAPEGPLAKATLREGDTLLEADGKKVRTPDDVAAAIDANDAVKIKFYRPDYEFTVTAERSNMPAGGTAMERLGIREWNKSWNWRSRGFYGHYTTYAEVLQLIASLVFGLLVGWFAISRIEKETVSDRVSARFLASPFILGSCLAAMCFALLLTVTRAPQLAFVISCFTIVLFGLSRKWLLIAIVIGVPVALGGLLFLQQSREVGFFDPNDDSIKWRQTVWREGFDLWQKSPRNLMVGVGMDSVKRFADEWKMFDNGRLNPGHFHSMPLQLLTERGIPALLLWLIVLGIYARTLWKGIKNSKSGIDRGILLGCLGGTVGFFASGFVHYNLGDQEVAMIFYLLMALGVRTAESVEHFTRTQRIVQ